MKIGTSARNAACNAIVDLLNDGTLEIRTGSAPTNPGDSDSGTLLATFTLPSPAFGDSSTGVATANSISNVTAVATGTAAHYRVKTSGSVVVMQDALDGSTLSIDDTSITSGDTVSVTSWTVTMPAGS